MAAPRGTVTQVTAYLLARPHGAYSQAEVQAIAADYFTVAGPLGLDPLIAASQMIEETAHLSSFWSQPPRHSMACMRIGGWLARRPATRSPRPVPRNATRRAGGVTGAAVAPAAGRPTRKYADKIAWLADHRSP